MIPYHGGPITPDKVAVAVWRNRHAFVSYAYQQQTALAFEAARTVAFDNGTFTAWLEGRAPDFDSYVTFCDEWHRHPSFDWALIPDIIDGTESDNDAMLEAWPSRIRGVPVYHLHESLERANRLALSYPTVALGSSGSWPDPGTPKWWRRMDEVMRAVCDEQGRPLCRLHGLRMLDPEIYTRLPLASADSTNIARNVGMDTAWRGTYQPASKEVRALVMVDRIEAHRSAPAYEFNPQQELLETTP